VPALQQFVEVSREPIDFLGSLSKGLRLLRPGAPHPAARFGECRLQRDPHFAFRIAEGPENGR
jgi:hypothetical protein